MGVAACENRGIIRLDDPRRKGVSRWDDTRTYEEWLLGLLDFMERKGNRTCRICGGICRCQKIGLTPNGGIWIRWQCHRGHIFGQVKSQVWLHKTYKSNTKKRR